MQYRDSNDVCYKCGKTGGHHYTDYRGISWCYGNERIQRPDDPRYQTSFTYLEKMPEYIDKGL